MVPTAETVIASDETIGTVALAGAVSANDVSVDAGGVVAPPVEAVLPSLKTPRSVAVPEASSFRDVVVDAEDAVAPLADTVTTTSLEASATIALAQVHHALRLMQADQQSTAMAPENAGSVEDVQSGGPTAELVMEDAKIADAVDESCAAMMEDGDLPAVATMDAERADSAVVGVMEDLECTPAAMDTSDHSQPLVTAPLPLFAVEAAAYSLPIAPPQPTAPADEVSGRATQSGFSFTVPLPSEVAMDTEATSTPISSNPQLAPAVGYAG